MEKKKKKINILFYVNFVIATIAITEFFTSNKYFAVGNDTKGYLVLVSSLVILAISLFMMAFQIYSEEKDKDNLRVSFAPFEFLYKIRNEARSCEKKDSESLGVVLR
jgi:hypothetical protein